MAFLYSQTKPTINISHHQKNIKNHFKEPFYQKSLERLEKAINMEVKQISKKLELNNRIECLAKNLVFISLKNH